MTLATQDAELEARRMALTIAEAADQMQIVDQPTNGAVSDFMLGIKVAAKKIGDFFKPQIEKAYCAHKELVARSKDITGPLNEAETILKRKISDWDTTQRRIREREAQQRAEEARRNEEEDRLRAAVEAEQAGQPEIAEEILNAPPAPVTVAVPQAPVIPGVAFTEKWTFRVVDANLVPRQFLEIDNLKLGQFARTMKGEAKVAGIEFYSEKVVTGRVAARAPRFGGSTV